MSYQEYGERRRLEREQKELFRRTYAEECRALEQKGFMRRGGLVVPDPAKQVAVLMIPGFGSKAQDFFPIKESLDKTFGRSLASYVVPAGGYFTNSQTAERMVASRMQEVVCAHPHLEVLITLPYSYGGRVAASAFSAVSSSVECVQISLATPYADHKLESLEQFPDLMQLTAYSPAVQEWPVVRFPSDVLVEAYYSNNDGIVQETDIGWVPNMTVQRIGGLHHKDFMRARKIVPYLVRDPILNQAAKELS